MLRGSFRGAPDRRRRSPGDRGFTIIEIATSILVLSVGCLTVAGVIIPMDRQREATEAKALVIEHMEQTFERLRGLDPDAVNLSYQGKTLLMQDLDASIYDSDRLATSVDSSNPELLDVTFTATWDVAGVAETFTIRTKVYNP